MIEFTRITSEDLYEKTSTLRQYFNAQQTNFSDFSCGFTFMWKDYSKMCYCITRSCLVIKQDYENGKVGFTYPCSLTGNIEDEKLALRDIEEYAMSERYKLLRYCVVSEQQKTALLEHYKDQVSITNDRIWQDYLYLSESFKTYSGKKLSGQRNHVNKFISTYPNYLVKEYKAEDEERLRLFEKEFEEQYSFSERGLAKTELLEAKKLISEINNLNLLCAYLEIDGKIVAFSIGEIVAGTLIVHIEKALSKYSGAYTLMAQEFAKLYADGEYINREDDAGDLGLRISKTQYRPYALLHKYEVTVNRSFNSLFKLPTLTTERLTLSALKSEDCETYDKLNLDNALNIYWGYDYREDLRQELYNGYFLDVAKKDFKEKTVLCFGIRLNGELIGETVLQNFDFHSQAEVGCRVFSDFAGRGYGREALKATLSWAIKYLHLDKVVAKCYIQNTASFIMLVKSGMREVDKDDKFIYFEL